MNNQTGLEAHLTETSLLHRMINRIRQSLELEDILSATVAEMRSFLQTDRVKIYRFEEDGTGVVIAESIYKDRLPSLKNLHFPAGDIPPHAREMFVKARQRNIVNVASQLMTISRVDCPDTTGDLTVEDVREQAITDILQRPVDPCHVEYLHAMGVISSVVVPILDRQKLWGLLISHHSEPKEFSVRDLEIVQRVADQVSIAIAQSNLLSETRAKAKREALVNHISQLLHSSLKVEQILQTVLSNVVKAVGGSAGRLYISSTEATLMSELYTCGEQPKLTNGGQSSLLEDYSFWQKVINADNFVKRPLDYESHWDELVFDLDQDSNGLLDNSFAPNLQAINDLYQHPQLAALGDIFEDTRIRSLLIMPLHYSQHSLGCLTIFRNEVDTDILWAGIHDSDKRQQRVRDSFEAWRELKRGQVKPWIENERELIAAIGNHLSMAVMQNRLYQWEHEHRLLVEMRNKELNIARTAAEEANRLKSDFLSSTSHELRTPLASTLNYLKLLKEGFYDDEDELQEYVPVAYQSAANLTNIINDVLDIAKIEAGRMQVNWELVNLGTLLAEKCDLFKIESQSKKVPLIIESEVNIVWADQIKLGQVLTNLISNAFKFTHSGEVRVTAVKLPSLSPSAPPMVEIAVSDTGIGIEPNQKNRLFEAFVQADGSVRRGYGGTGLGLTICKRLVELMGGQIKLHSEGLSKGTTVSFTLLAQQPSNQK